MKQSTVKFTISSQSAEYGARAYCNITKLNTFYLNSASVSHMICGDGRSSEASSLLGRDFIRFLLIIASYFLLLVFFLFFYFRFQKLRLFFGAGRSSLASSLLGTERRVAQTL